MLKMLTKSNPFFLERKKAEPARDSLSQNSSLSSAERTSQNATRSEYSGGKKKQGGMSIGILGSKGGAGASLLALNLTLALSKNGFNSTLVDANLQQADIAVMLGKQPEHSVADFASRSHEYENSLLEACGLKIGTYAKARALLLSGPADGQAAQHTNLSKLALSLRHLKTSEDFVIVDLPKHLDKHLVNMLDELDHLILIFENTVTGIAGTKRWLKIFKDLAYPQKKLSFVENRHGAKGQNHLPDIESIIANKPIALIPNSFLFTQECTILAEPALVRNKDDKYSKAVLELAKKLELMRIALADGGLTDD